MNYVRKLIAAQIEDLSTERQRVEKDLNRQQKLADGHITRLCEINSMIAQLNEALVSLGRES
jgi:hypothetical protein